MKIRHRQTRTIRHAELTELFATYGELSPTAAKRLIPTLVSIIVSALSFGHTVQVHKLGTFRPIAKRPHKAFDSRQLVSEYYEVRFTSSKALLKSMKQTDRFRRADSAYQNPEPDTHPPSETFPDLQELAGE